jgi:protein-S-isoprenylcysteine O-methyltransferase Ste14
MLELIKKSITIVVLTIAFIILFVLFKTVITIPGLVLWNGINKYYNISIFKLNIFQIIHVILGFILWLYATYNVLQISKLNREAHVKGKNDPVRLITTGYYEKVRHPMYAMFMLSELGIFLSLYSLIGILISAVFILIYSFNGWYEEKYILIKIFGNEYENYKMKTKTRFFSVPELIYIIFFILIAVMGIVFSK